MENRKNMPININIIYNENPIRQKNKTNIPFAPLQPQ